MIIFKLLKNPLVKICGVCLVMYFGLFSDRKNPNSLSQRFSSENIDKSKDVAANKIQFIATNIQVANSEKRIRDEKNKIIPSYEVQKHSEENEEEKKVMVRDLQEGSINNPAICGSNVQIVYVIFDQMSNQIESSPLEKLVVGSNKDSLIENNLIGMKEGGVREVVVWPDAKISDQKILKLIKRYNSKLRIDISMVSIGDHNSKVKCN